jgi:hypothetical protein
MSLAIFAQSHLDCGLKLQTRPSRTGRGSRRQSALQDADAALDRLRLYLRLAHVWGWLNDGQYAHVSAQVAEFGKLLGGWIRQSAA